MQIDGDAVAPRQPLGLLVDGDEQSRLLCRTTLAEAGFEVITATDVAAALLVASVTAPDVVLLDIDLPTLGPLVLPGSIRANFRDSDAQVIALTREPAPHEHVGLLATRFDRVLVKPADRQRLLEAVSGALVPG